jgi:glycosyltransferase involved in cell wall biosynthesis
VDKKNVDSSAKTNVDAVATTSPQAQHEASHEVITFSPEEMSSINDRINTSLFYPYTPPVNLITDSVFSYKKLNNGELDNLANEIRKKIAKNQDNCVFLYVGRLAMDKGLFDLIEAFRLTFISLKKIELWFVAPNEEGLQFELEAIAQTNNLPITFIGPTDLPEDYMRAADVFVLPSYREGFGTVIIEAGACCVPAIAYRIDGVVDAIEDGFSGILATLKDIESLSKSMLFLAENPSRRIEMGNNARNRVEKFFSSDAITSAWLAQYKTVLH